MNTPDDIWAIGRLSSVERVNIDADGIHVRLNSLVGFNTVSSHVTLTKPERVLDEVVSTGSVEGHAVLVSLPVAQEATA